MDFPKKYGANVVMWGLLNHIVIMITDPKDVETIMNSNTTKKSFAYDYLEPWLGKVPISFKRQHFYALFFSIFKGQGLLTSYGKKWHTRRKILTPSFHFSILEQFIQVFNKHNAKLIENLLDHQKKSSCQELNIYEFITACALDNICETAMGVSVNAQNNENGAYVKAVKE